MLSMLFRSLCSHTLSLIEMNLLGGGQQSGLMALAFILLTHFGDTIPKDINQTVFLFYKLFSLHQNGATDERKDDHRCQIGNFAGTSFWKCFNMLKWNILNFPHLFSHWQFSGNKGDRTNWKHIYFLTDNKAPPRASSIQNTLDIFTWINSLQVWTKITSYSIPKFWRWWCPKR